MIKVKNAYYRYDGREYAVKNVSLNVKRGEILSILGPNGCGKSTLLKIMLGFAKPSAGSVELEERDLSSLTRWEIAKKLCYVPQSHLSVFPYSVKEVVLMGASAAGYFKPYSSADHRRAEESMECMGITRLASRAYSALSGGERQLVLIARAMTQNAGVFFMDEPVSSLDYGNQYKLLNEILRLRNMGFTFVITTQHPDHALYLSGNAVLMKNGSVVTRGKVEDAVTEDALYHLYGIRVKNFGLAV